MTSIRAYKFQPEELSPTLKGGFGGFNTATNTLTPMSGLDGNEWWMFEVLSNLTMACEAGLLTEDGWVAQVFATPADFDAFLEQMEDYDDCFAIRDRWHRALMAVGKREEEGFNRTADIAAELRSQAVETGQA
jgi:hypothetical protein